MQILSQILATLPDGEVHNVYIGLHWTAVIAEVDRELRCGLASTLHGGPSHDREPDVPEAGQLERHSARELSELALSDRPTLSSVGMAAVNALLPRSPEQWGNENAEDLIAGHGAGKRAVMVGRFPFTERLRPRVGELLVLEQYPGPDDLPAERAPEVLPAADVVAITGMTFANHTLEPLLALCPPQAYVILLGPSTPLAPLLFDYGVDVLSGAVVNDIDPVLHVLMQGGNFRQLHHAGVRLANLYR